MARALELALELEGIPARSVPGPEEAVEAVGAGGVDLVIQDMNFSPGATSGEEGIALFRRLRALSPRVPVLLVTAWGCLETAVRLMQEGAADYLEKPWDDERLLRSVHDLLAATGAGDGARGVLADRADLCGLVYASSAMHEVVSLAVRVARADVPVLITGANGTGKERLADVVQANSGRRRRPYLKVNAGALPDTLLEAELFGAEAGAYTGAGRRRIGRFEAADGGTLLLDEIGNLSAAGQAKLLRVLQSGEFERLGSSETRRVDVRVLAATNADLAAEIAAGRFRQDLYYRLAVIEIAVPPLGRRPADVLPLADHLLRRYAVEHGRPELSFGPAARQALESHGWPGNVRELENRVQRACLVAARDVILPADLDLAADGALRPAVSPAAPDLADDPERTRIESVLRECGGVVSRAAERLGVSRQSLYRRMRRLGIVVERTPRSLEREGEGR